MHVANYYKDVFVPANRAISELRMAGLPIDLDRVHATARKWEARIGKLEKFLTSEAEKHRIDLRFSAAHVPDTAALHQFLFSPQGLGLEVGGFTERGRASTDDEALANYASVAQPRAEDDKRVWSLLKIRSLAKGMGTFLRSFERTMRADGCCHPKFNWALRTARLSAEDPPVHQIPERADLEVANGVKSCIVPRFSPARTDEEWDPRKHGSCFRWDIAGAEAAIRGAMLTHRFLPPGQQGVLWDYIRQGKDVHGRTAALIHDKPEGTYKKGDPERDQVGKQVFFARLFGGSWKTVQRTVWSKARQWIQDEQAKRISQRFDDAYPELRRLYDIDKIFLGEHRYVEDGYGRRRGIPFPHGVKYTGSRGGRALWNWTDERAAQALEKCWHLAANTPTQSMNATDCLWMVAMLVLGEYVELRVPPMWEQAGGVLYPEARLWRLNGGPGPGGKPFQAFVNNTVHDSCWGDCAPGMLEPVMKVCFRRCTALPFDWRIESDVPYRIDFQVGPDFGHLRDYNDIAKEFGLEPYPKR